MVRVVAPVRGVKLVFGAIFGVTNVDISAQAQASIRLGGQANCGLCIVGRGYHDFQNGDAYISGGDISINGSVNIQNNGMVSTDGVISVEGTASGPLDGYDPDPLTGQEPILDPLANYDPGHRLHRADGEVRSLRHRLDARAGPLRRAELPQRHVHAAAGGLRHHRRVGLLRERRLSTRPAA